MDQTIFIHDPLELREKPFYICSLEEVRTIRLNEAKTSMAGTSMHQSLDGLSTFFLT